MEKTKVEKPKKLKGAKVGDIVKFHPHKDDKVSFSNGHPGPIAAIVTRVWPGDDGMVNLKIVPDCGPMEDRGSVRPKSDKQLSYCYE